MTVCNALCSPEGILYVGTRNLEFSRAREDREVSIRDPRKRQLQFYDAHNFSATFRNSVWTLQRFHDTESLRLVTEAYFEDVEIVDHKRSDIYAICRKPKRLPMKEYRAALEAEFNMEYPGQTYHGQHMGLVREILNRLRIRGN